MIKALFHITRPGYRPGEIRERSYGQALITDGFDLSNDANGEFSREAIRREHYPGKPCRLNSSFAFESEQAAREYKRLMRRDSEAIYMVRFVDNTEPIHRVFWGLWKDDLAGPMRTATAHEFWRSTGPDHSDAVEVFAETDLEILDVLSA
ncbi:hypothetical protein [Alicycliphilus denitrificans]|uniref:hypothetical protein n=1 Tax=Alicycliphilus denitrificans TaxID=179636 RepID=UPI000C9EF9ED|nr:hypothetical protein [Alicycliphilus denitrificans]